MTNADNCGKKGPDRLSQRKLTNVIGTRYDARSKKQTLEEKKWKNKSNE